MSKRYYDDYKFDKEKQIESKIFPIKEEIKEEIKKQPMENIKTPAAAPEVQEKIVKVYCNVRKSPMGEIVTIYEVGKKVKVVEEIDGWYKLDNGLFIRSDLLR